MGEKERRKEKYMHSKMPKRPDLTQVEVPNPGLTLPPNKAPKRDNGSDMDHMGEINTLKEKIISLEKQISAKNRELIAKDQEITQMKAKVFNEEKLIREKVTEMSDKLRSMQAELAKLRKTDNNNSQKRKTNSTNLFHDKNKKVAKVASRTASPLSRSRSRSRSPVREKPRSRSGSRSRSPASRKSRSLSPSGVNREKGGADSRVGSPAPNTKAE